MRVHPMFLMTCVGRIMDAASTRKKAALGASVMRRSATSNPTPKFLRRSPQMNTDCFIFAAVLVIQHECLT